MRSPPATAAAGKPHPLQGFTLLEVLLALLLASLVVMALATAIDVHLRVVDSSRTHVEEAQLARAMLNLIADDLRNTLVYNPPETGQSGTPAGSSATGAEPSGDEPDSAETDESSESAESGVPQSVPGLYGGSDWLMIDVSRLPRLDQYDYELTSSDDSSLADRLSDVKAVTYYVQEETETGLQPGDPEYRGGLVRRELDRAVSLWAAEQGLLTETELDEEPIAPEVAIIEFLYFDGLEWVDSWDTDEMGGLPAAVKIALAIIPFDADSSQFSTLWTSGGSGSSDDVRLMVYYLIVPLPVSEASSGGEASDDLGTL